MNGCVCTGQESLAERDHASFYLKEATRFCSKYGKDLILEYQAYMWCIDIHVRKTPIYTKISGNKKKKKNTQGESASLWHESYVILQRRT